MFLQKDDLITVKTHLSYLRSFTSVEFGYIQIQDPATSDAPDVAFPLDASEVAAVESRNHHRVLLPPHLTCCRPESDVEMDANRAQPFTTQLH